MYLYELNGQVGRGIKVLDGGFTSSLVLKRLTLPQWTYLVIFHL
jgi:hypothetical protein